MFTCEFTHDGKRGQMSNDAPDERMARIAFSQNSKRAVGVCVIHDETIKQHATVKDMQAEVARFRESQGKSPEPSEDELRQNAINLLCHPVAVAGSDNEDHVWW